VSVTDAADAVAAEEASLVAQVAAGEGVYIAVDYEPAESTTATFGGNANWPGPLWFPFNFLVISCLERYSQFFGDDFALEYPCGCRKPVPPGRMLRSLLAARSRVADQGVG
jgi:hypothetical protein